MAEQVAIAGTGATAKIRSPIGVLGLTVITLSIYSIFWWYFINRELADLGRATGSEDLGDKPGLSTLAWTLGGFIIVPPFVTVFGTSKRIETAQEKVLGSNNFSPVVVLACFIGGFFLLLPFLAVPILMQSNLNQVWERQRQG